MTGRAALHTKTAPLSITPDASRPVERRSIPDTALSVYPLALGGSVFGWTADGDTSMQILDRHADLGGNLIDTADSYAGGRSEVLIGNWLRSRRARENTVIATKAGRNFDYPGLTSRSIIGAVHASLERLQTDYIDLLYFHFDDTAVPLEESLGAVDVLLRSGHVRHIGASNFSADRLMEARVLTANGLPRFVASQSLYNLVHREPFESAVGVVTGAQGMAVFPHSALAHGFLTGKYHGRADVKKTARGASASAYLNRKSLRTLGVVERVATAHGEQPASIALAWLLSRQSVVAPVASASRPDQVAALMAAGRIRLTRGDLLDLDRVSALPH
ncbi:MAG TPA: aldo/keto reductase [Glaciibacter sp.]|nr:aldo/keto reductase [Glaciibacter sp.]